MGENMKPIVLVLIALMLAAGVALIGCGGGDDDDDGRDNTAPGDDDATPEDYYNDDDSAGDDDDDDDDDDNDDNDDDTTFCDWDVHDPLIVAGKDHLGQSEIYEGYEAFADAWSACPDSIDARMGLALACQLDLERAVAEVVRYLMTNPITPKDKGLGSIVQSFLKYHFLPKVQEFYGHAQAVRQAPADWSFWIDSYPFLVDGEFPDRVAIDMGGEWDHADAMMMEAFARLFEGMIRFLCAYDLTFDYGWMTGFPDLIGTPTQNIHAAAAWALGVLDDPLYPQFLTLLDDGGAQSVAEAGLAWGAMYLLIKEAADAMLTETDDQDDDLSGYADRNSNGQWDQGEPFKLPHIGYMTDDQNWVWIELIEVAVSAGYSTWDGSALDVHPNWPDLVWLSELNFLLEMIGLQPALPPIPFNFGPFYYGQSQTEFKQMIRGVIQFLFNWSAPKGGQP